MTSQNQKEESNLLDEMAVWLIAILVCLLALLAAVLRFRHNRRSRRKEEETFTSPKEDTPRNEIEVR